MNLNLTPKQLEVLYFILDYRHRRGISPTLSEIAGELGVSKITVYEHVEHLRTKGALKKEKYLSRSLSVPPELAAELTAHRPDRSALPLLGYIAAGQPIEAVEQAEVLELTDLVKAEGPIYLLRVRGNSMIDEQIRDGDYVIVERRSSADDGQTVVAIVGDNEATLKKIYREGSGWRLQPANPEMRPIRAEKVEIRGVVVGVLRRY